MSSIEVVNVFPDIFASSPPTPSRRQKDLAVGFGIRPVSNDDAVILEMGRDKFYKVNLSSAAQLIVEGTEDESRFKKYEEEYRAKIRSSWTNVKKRDKLRLVDMYTLANYSNANTRTLKYMSTYHALGILLKCPRSKNIHYEDFTIKSIEDEVCA